MNKIIKRPALIKNEWINGQKSPRNEENLYLEPTDLIQPYKSVSTDILGSAVDLIQDPSQKPLMGVTID